MANTNIRCTITTDASKFASVLIPVSGAPESTYKRFRNLFRVLCVGAFNSRINVMTGGTAATGTVTLSSFVATNTVTVNGIVLTGRASPTLVTEFKIGTSDIITATNLAACINAHNSLACDVIATQAATPTAVVTITAAIPGIVGNLMTLAISANGSVSGAALTGGVAGTCGRATHGIAF